MAGKPLSALYTFGLYKHQNIYIMKKLIIFASSLLLTAVVLFSASSFTTKQITQPAAFSETCTDWSGHGIQFRQCATDWGLRSHQFYNGYDFQIRIHAQLTFTDGTKTSTLEIYIDPRSASDKASNDGGGGVNKVVDRWTILQKERKDEITNKWVDFI